MTTTALLPCLKTVHKRTRFVLDQVLNRVDRFGRQLPMRLVSEVLAFLGSQEVARSQTVCSGWILPRIQQDRLWKMLYMSKWARLDLTDSYNSPDVAIHGPTTAWLERYKRRHETEMNWELGQCRTVRIHPYLTPTTPTTPEEPTPRITCRHLSVSGNYLFFVTLYDVHVLDTRTDKVVHIKMVTDSAVHHLISSVVPSFFSSGPSRTKKDDVWVFMNASDGGWIRALLAPELNLVKEYNFSEGITGGVKDIEGLETDGHKLVVMGRVDYGKQLIRIWDVKSGETLRRVDLMTHSATMAVDWLHQRVFLKTKFDPYSLTQLVSLSMSDPQSWLKPYFFKQDSPSWAKQPWRIFKVFIDRHHGDEMFCIVQPYHDDDYYYERKTKKDQLVAIRLEDGSVRRLPLDPCGYFNPTALRGHHRILIGDDTTGIIGIDTRFFSGRPIHACRIANGYAASAMTHSKLYSADSNYGIQCLVFSPPISLLPISVLA